MAPSHVNPRPPALTAGADKPPSAPVNVCNDEAPVPAPGVGTGTGVTADESASDRMGSDAAADDDELG